MSAFLQRIRTVSLAIVVAAVVSSFALSLTAGQEDAAGPTTATARTETALPQLANRADCTAIGGTEYLSEEERIWYLASCIGPAPAPIYSDSSYVPPPPGRVYGVEYGTADRLVIPAAGIDAPVNGMDVELDGVMKDPTSFFSAVWYNFAAIPGLGGYVESGNLVMAGHVDCARCYNGLSGAAIFYNLRYVTTGNQIIYRSGSLDYYYEIVSVGDFPSDSDWTAITASGNADLTIITCAGTFDTSAREYTHRRVVFAMRLPPPI